MAEFKLDQLQATILYKTWWYHPTSGLNGAFEKAKEVVNYFKADETITTKIQQHDKQKIQLKGNSTIPLPILNPL